MCWHRWGKWEDAQGKMSSDEREAALQIKYCLKCNKKKARKITVV